MMSMKSYEWESKIESKIQTLVNHFVRKPSNYFTESDIHSYLYLAFYRDKIFSSQFPTANPIKKTILIHREYPTFFKYDKKIPIVPKEDAKSRGHYDFVVLNPRFVESYSLSIVTNKNYHLLPKKFKYKPVIAAIEFKYIIRRINKDMLENIEIDFQKPQASTPYSSVRYVLIFNSFGSLGKYIREIERMKRENPSVKAVYAGAWYDGDNKKSSRRFWLE